MRQLTEESVLDALRMVKDPDLKRDIVALNFVKDLQISRGDVSFTIELTTPACPVRDQLKTAAEKAIRDTIKDVGRIDIGMTSKVVAHDNKA